MKRFGAAVAVAMVAALLATALPARAKWSASSGGGSATRSTSIAASTSLSGVGQCVVIVLVPRVRLTWTASTTSVVTGYDIARSTVNGGPYTVVGSVSGSATVTYDDYAVTTNKTYYYVVRARLQQWTTANSPQATASTPFLCL